MIKEAYINDKKKIVASHKKQPSGWTEITRLGTKSRNKTI